MGLRIIDRVRPLALGFHHSESETAARTGLEREAARNFAAIDGDIAAEDKFLAKLHALRGRVLTPNAMLDRAIEVRTCIRLMQTNAQPVHTKIDIATLIELL